MHFSSDGFYLAESQFLRLLDMLNMLYYLRLLLLFEKYLNKIVCRMSGGDGIVVGGEWSKDYERELLFARLLNTADLLCIAVEAGLTDYSDLCKKAREAFIYIPDDLKRRIIKECVEKISDEKLMEAFKKVKPKLYPENVPFRGNYYLYLGNGDFQLKSSWSDVKKDAYELLSKGGERIYAFLKAVIELTVELLKKHGPEYCYLYGPDYGSILKKMYEILGRLETLLPRDFVLLKASGIYYKSGSQRHPGHSIPLEIIPAIKEVLEEWKKSRDISSRM
jgi:hypothetical protein